MGKDVAPTRRTIFWMVIGIFIIAVVISGLSSYLSGHRLVGRKVLPNFNPGDVAIIEIDGATNVSRVDGRWKIVPFDGYPANDDLIMHNLRDVADMTVCAVERNSRRKLQVMEKKHEVVFRDKDGESVSKRLIAKGSGVRGTIRISAHDSQISNSTLQLQHL